jgi:hypothetical protein
MARTALFEGLVFDEKKRPLDIGRVGIDACYLYDDDGFLRHLDAAEIDHTIMRFFKEQVLENKEMAIRGMLEMMGKDDIFTKTTLEYQVEHMDEDIEKALPPQARGILRTLGFKIIIDAQGNITDMQSPDLSALQGMLGLDDTD